MNGSLTPLSQCFAAYLGALDPDCDDLLRQTLQLASHGVSEGHVCMDLAHYAGSSLAETDPESFPFPEADIWAERLRRSPLVGTPGEFRPLILDQSLRLYLTRYWHYESSLAERLIRRAEAPVENVDLDALRSELDRLFAHNKADPDWQKVAAAAAVLQRFCVISGGPGTGKTSTVIRLLAALQSQAGSSPLRIGLAAPTGKAAARMQEAIRSAKAALGLNPVRLETIPENASTLHRLLGSRPDSVYFRHHRGNPLPLDVLVVDEASMVDLALMAKLVDALPDCARLILLGDKDQLASVEAGAVFGDICACRRYDDTFRRRLLRACGMDIGETAVNAGHLGNAIVLLQKSYRFTADSGIGELARRINGNLAREALELLQSNRFDDIAWVNAPVGGLKKELGERLDQGYRDYFEAVGGGDVSEVFRRFSAFKVLCAHRDGNAGIQAVNRYVEERLRARRHMGYRSLWYPGRPVMITHNDYNLKLFNGDVGITLKEGDVLRVYFQSDEGHVRSFAPARLPPHETVYAMTVHKSQGSEFDRVLILLPDTRSEVLNRPLLYTGLTRARQYAEIWGRRQVLEQAISNFPKRASGLREKLQGSGN